MTGIGQYLLKVKSKCLKICLCIDIDASLFGVYVYMTWFSHFVLFFLVVLLKVIFDIYHINTAQKNIVSLSQSIHFIIKACKKKFNVLTFAFQNSLSL